MIAFNRGNELYRAGKYQEAANEYEGIIKQGKLSAELYFNLGNAYYRNGQLARAILSYERAAQLHPNDPDIEHNLKLAYLKTVDRIEAVPGYVFNSMDACCWIFDTARNYSCLFISFWVLLFGSLATIIDSADEIFFASQEFYSLFPAFQLYSATSMLGIQSFRDTAKDKAIITAQTVTAKSSPDVKAVDAFVIHEGVKVKLTDAVGDWVKVTLVDGKIGWIPADQCERI